MTTARRHLKRGGYVADYNTTSSNSDYILYNNSAVDTTSNPLNYVLPGIKGGANDLLYGTDGGCAACGMNGGATRKKERRQKRKLNIKQQAPKNSCKP